MDREPEPDYAWTATGDMLRFDVETMIRDGERFYRIWGDHWLPLTDEILDSWGWVKTETPESKIARLEWKVRQLERELDKLMNQ
jgi:hypothetical protein